MAVPFVYRRRVQFAETDLAGIVHFSNFYKFMEEAEHAFLRSKGLGIKEDQPDGTVLGWPRVRGTCSFEQPAYYEDELDIEVRIDRLGVKSLTLSFTILRDGSRIAVGELKTVCCRFGAAGKFESVEIPPHWLDKLQESEPA
ncbi:MAG: thioesterase family protein [Planctomycetota bacterium]|nr:thioesterase family protein [Planctomycetota bacterium]